MPAGQLVRQVRQSRLEVRVGAAVSNSRPAWQMRVERQTVLLSAEQAVSWYWLLEQLLQGKQEPLAARKKLGKQLQVEKSAAVTELMGHGRHCTLVVVLQLPERNVLPEQPQGWQVVAPGAEAKVPAVQGVQGRKPLEENEPAGQATGTTVMAMPCCANSKRVGSAASD